MWLFRGNEIRIRRGKRSSKPEPTDRRGSPTGKAVNISVIKARRYTNRGSAKPFIGGVHSYRGRKRSKGPRGGEGRLCKKVTENNP